MDIQEHCIRKMGKIRSELKLLFGVYYSWIPGSFDTVTSLRKGFRSERAAAGLRPSRLAPLCVDSAQALRASCCSRFMYKLRAPSRRCRLSAPQRCQTSPLTWTDLVKPALHAAAGADTVDRGAVVFTAAALQPDEKDSSHQSMPALTLFGKSDTSRYLSLTLWTAKQ